MKEVTFYTASGLSQFHYYIYVSSQYENWNGKPLAVWMVVRQTLLSFGPTLGQHLVLYGSFCTPPLLFVLDKLCLNNIWLIQWRKWHTTHHRYNNANSENKEHNVAYCSETTNTSHWANVESMLVHRLRRWPTIDSTLIQWLLFAGKWLHVVSFTLLQSGRQVWKDCNFCSSPKNCTFWPEVI